MFLFLFSLSPLSLVSQKLPDYEFSEMILYEVQLLLESGAYKDALKFLEDFRHYVSDMLAYAEIKGK